MQGSHTLIPGTNHVPRRYIVAVILSLLFMVPLIIIIVIIINCNWVVTRWQWLFYMYTNMKKRGARWCSG